MIGVFSSLKSLISFDKVVIDNGVFVLHYKVTVVILLTSTILISCKQHFGEPITCLADNNDVRFGRAVDSYCWVHSTYTVKELTGAKTGVTVLRPGVGQLTPHNTRKPHKYYQWVSFFLLFQAWLFYFPRFLWKLWEGGKVRALCLNLDNSLDFRQRELVARRKAVAAFLLRSFRRHRQYAAQYFICELLNLLNILFQVVLTDRFLGHEFSTYGRDVLTFVMGGMTTGRTDPMDKVFPKLTKCTYNQFGPSGNIIPYDLICILPLNILNEKIFVLLWFWYIIVAGGSFAGLIYRMTTICSKKVRRYRLESKASLCDEFELTMVSRYCEFGDWLILHQLSKNMDPFIFAELLRDLAIKFKQHGLLAIRYQQNVLALGLNSPTDKFGFGGQNKNHAAFVPVSESSASEEPIYDCVPPLDQV